MHNPLLDTSSLPRFRDISPEHVLPAIEKIIADQRSQLSSLLNTDADPEFDSLVVPVEQMEHELTRVWSPVSHLQSVLGSQDWREAYNAALPLLTEFGTELSQNTHLQRAYASVFDKISNDSDEARRSAVEQSLRDFRLAGVDLDDNHKSRFKAIMQELAACQAKFEHNVQDATDAWSLHLDDEARLKGLPVATRSEAANAASDDNKSGWLLSLDYPTYDAVMTHADDRSLRETFYRAWSTRASDSGDLPNCDNSDNIRRILELRHEAALLVGFESYAEYSLATKMALSTDDVIEFLRQLARHSRKTAEEELACLTERAGFTLQPWDVTYWIERHKQDKYAVSNETLRQYFPAEKVISGLFELASRLYNVSLHIDEDIDAWHKDANYYRVVDADNVAIGGFYTDLYARNGKRGGAWIDECIGRESLSEQTTLPVGYLVCNFPRPDENGTSLLTHDDVVTLFHEFGHMLHHLLTRIDVPSVSGINGVPWDAVELPSQFMENFAWSYDVLERCSEHAETGESLPSDAYEKLARCRNVGAGLAMMRQIELALFDFLLHTDYDPTSPAEPLDVLRAVRDEVSLLNHPEYNRFPHTFMHIFSGGYAAGYYSYKWAEVLAADAFSAFEEGGIFNSDTAKKFRQEILEVGGSRNFMDAYKAFRGREPTIDALLRQNDIEPG